MTFELRERRETLHDRRNKTCKVYENSDLELLLDLNFQGKDGEKCVELDYVGSLQVMLSNVDSNLIAMGTTVGF